ncbi:hypothetical protein D9757_003163 [Collybiopsis confluens]|uniref:Uncharacterized protein n=1 Tax=Collybiopsis confluens TaxID=2823264 RepID=A0A8H5HXX4_9AGAR|nr:hypothetical protein D9757_003163 [Collybiopsis confluens]
MNHFDNQRYQPNQRRTDPKERNNDPRLLPAWVLVDSDFPSNVTVQIISAFVPFTMTKVLVVRASPPCDCLSRLLRFDLEPFVLKVYDPRFFDHRHKNTPERPWSLETERIAAANRGDGRRNLSFDTNDWPEDDDQAGWEEWYYQHSELQFHSEISAYTLLTPLQG